MSETREYATSGTTEQPGIGRRGIVIMAAVAVVVVASIGGAVAAKLASQPESSTASKANAASSAASSPTAKATPAPAKASTSPRARPATFPPAAERDIGGRYWAVYLALPRVADDPKATAAERNVLAAGYDSSDIAYGPIDCDDGARAALGKAGIRLDPNVDYGTVKLFFSTRQNATAFVDAYQPGVIGTALVTWSCAD